MQRHVKPFRRSLARATFPVLVLLTIFTVLLYFFRSSLHLPSVVSSATGAEPDAAVSSRALPAGGDAPPTEWSDGGDLNPPPPPPPEPVAVGAAAEPASGDWDDDDEDAWEDAADELPADVGTPDTRVDHWKKAMLERDAAIDAARRSPVPLADRVPDREGCLPWIFYDKPIKTGSTAVTYAIREYVMARGQRHRRCSRDSCTPRAEAACNGTGDPEHLIGHVRVREGMVECLKGKQFYAATSIRDPLERWRSAFKFNRMMKGHHNGIMYTETFDTFMKLYPDCQMYQYYDQMSSECDRAPVPWRERLEKIIHRYDEVIDLYDDNEELEGVLFKKIKGYLAKENVSKQSKEVITDKFDRSRLEPEQALYDALKAKRKEKPDPTRFPC